MLIKALETVKFNLYNRSVEFDDSGDPPAFYDIVFWDWKKNRTFVTVGSFHSVPTPNFSLDQGLIAWHTGKNNFITAYKNVSSNLRKHVKRRHEPHLEEYCQLTSTACKRPSEGGTGVKAKQLKLLETKQVSQKTVDRAILRFIVQGLQSFSLVEKPSFQDLVVELQPSSAVMSRTTVRRKIDSATSKMKERLKNEIKKVPYIATTTDCWAARRRSFIGVTAHWLDPYSFERRSAALACRQLRGSHTFDALAAVLTDIHAEYEKS
ncbi:uncharacterized protein LOC143131680 [Alosa pseudoharengus]|uniref:uncharacterized protein LOC143131680 n=1 Tax=Alosa pseudoharengus TaxID=34774 RepID=UPI003F8C1D1D